MIDQQQPVELERARTRIESLILDFARSCVANDESHFYMASLLAYVSERCTVAPDSPGRVLRQLKQAGRIDYEVRNRRSSLYRINQIKEAA